MSEAEVRNAPMLASSEGIEMPVRDPSPGARTEPTDATLLPGSVNVPEENVPLVPDDKKRVRFDDDLGNQTASPDKPSHSPKKGFAGSLRNAFTRRKYSEPDDDGASAPAKGQKGGKPSFQNFLPILHERCRPLWLLYHLIQLSSNPDYYRATMLALQAEMDGAMGAQAAKVIALAPVGALSVKPPQLFLGLTILRRFWRIILLLGYIAVFAIFPVYYATRFQNHTEVMDPSLPVVVEMQHCDIEFFAEAHAKGDFVVEASLGAGTGFLAGTDGTSESSEYERTNTTIRAIRAYGSPIPCNLKVYISPSIAAPSISVHGWLPRHTVTGGTCRFPFRYENQTYYDCVPVKQCDSCTEVDYCYAEGGNSDDSEGADDTDVSGWFGDDETLATEETAEDGEDGIFSLNSLRAWIPMSSRFVGRRSLQQTSASASNGTYVSASMQRCTESSYTRMKIHGSTVNDVDLITFADDSTVAFMGSSIDVDLVRMNLYHLVVRVTRGNVFVLNSALRGPATHSNDGDILYSKDVLRRAGETDAEPTTAPTETLTGTFTTSPVDTLTSYELPSDLFLEGDLPWETWFVHFEHLGSHLETENGDVLLYTGHDLNITYSTQLSDYCLTAAALSIMSEVCVEVCSNSTGNYTSGCSLQCSGSAALCADTDCYWPLYNDYALTIPYVEFYVGGALYATVGNSSSDSVAAVTQLESYAGESMSQRHFDTEGTYNLQTLKDWAEEEENFDYVVTIRLTGPGQDIGFWQFTNNPAYVYFPPWLLSVISASLLSPREKYIEARAIPTNCPFTKAWEKLADQDTLGEVSDLMRETIDADNSDALALEVTSAGGDIFNILAGNSDRFRLDRLANGKYTTTQLTLSESKPLFLALIFSIVIAGLGGIIGALVVTKMAELKLIKYLLEKNELEQYERLSVLTDNPKYSDPKYKAMVSQLRDQKGKRPVKAKPKKGVHHSLLDGADDIAQEAAATVWQKSKKIFKKIRGLFMSVVYKIVPRKSEREKNVSPVAIPHPFEFIELFFDAIRKKRINSLGVFFRARMSGSQGGGSEKTKGTLFLSDFQEQYETFCYRRGYTARSVKKAKSTLKKYGTRISTIMDASTDAYRCIKWMSMKELRERSQDQTSPLPGEGSLKFFIRSNCVLSGLPCDFIRTRDFQSRYGMFVRSNRGMSPQPITKRAMGEFGTVFERMSMSIVDTGERVIDLRGDSEKVQQRVGFGVLKDEGPTPLLWKTKDSVVVFCQFLLIMALPIPMVTVALYSQITYSEMTRDDDSLTLDHLMVYGPTFDELGIISLIVICGSIAFWAAGIAELVYFSLRQTYMEKKEPLKAAIDAKSAEGEEEAPAPPTRKLTPRRVIQFLILCMLAINITACMGYGVMLAIWLTLGAILNPNTFLPHAMAAVTLLVFALAKASKLQNARKKMKRKVMNAIQKKLKTVMEATMDNLKKKGKNLPGSDKAQSVEEGMANAATNAIARGPLGDLASALDLNIPTLLDIAKGEEEALATAADKLGLSLPLMLALVATVRRDQRALAAAVVAIASQPGLRVDEEVAAALFALMKRGSEDQFIVAAKTLIVKYAERSVAESQRLGLQVSPVDPALLGALLSLSCGDAEPVLSALKRNRVPNVPLSVAKVAQFMVHGVQGRPKKAQRCLFEAMVDVFDDPHDREVSSSLFQGILTLSGRNPYNSAVTELCDMVQINPLLVQLYLSKVRGRPSELLGLAEATTKTICQFLQIEPADEFTHVLDEAVMMLGVLAHGTRIDSRALAEDYDIDGQLATNMAHMVSGSMFNNALVGLIGSLDFKHFGWLARRLQLSPPVLVALICLAKNDLTGCLERGRPMGPLMALADRIAHDYNVPEHADKIAAVFVLCAGGVRRPALEHARQVLRLPARFNVDTLIYGREVKAGNLNAKMPHTLKTKINKVEALKSIALTDHKSIQKLCMHPLFHRYLYARGALRMSYQYPDALMRSHLQSEFKFTEELLAALKAVGSLPFIQLMDEMARTATLGDIARLFSMDVFVLTSLTNVAFAKPGQAEASTAEMLAALGLPPEVLAQTQVFAGTYNKMVQKVNTAVAVVPFVTDGLFGIPKFFVRMLCRGVLRGAAEMVIDAGFRKEVGEFLENMGLTHAGARTGLIALVTSDPGNFYRDMTEFLRKKMEKPLKRGSLTLSIRLFGSGPVQQLLEASEMVVDSLMSSGLVSDDQDVLNNTYNYTKALAAFAQCFEGKIEMVDMEMRRREMELVKLSAHQRKKAKEQLEKEKQRKPKHRYEAAAFLADALSLPEALLSAVMQAAAGNPEGAREDLLKVGVGMLDMDEATCRGLLSIGSGSVNAIEDVAGMVHADPDAAETLVILRANNLKYQEYRSNASLQGVLQRLGMVTRPVCCILALCSNAGGPDEAPKIAQDMECGLRPMDLACLSAIFYPEKYTPDSATKKNNMVANYIKPLGHITGIRNATDMMLITRLAQGAGRLVRDLSRRLGWRKVETEIYLVLAILSHRRPLNLAAAPNATWAEERNAQAVANFLGGSLHVDVHFIFLLMACSRGDPASLETLAAILDMSISELARGLKLIGTDGQHNFDDDAPPTGNMDDDEEEEGEGEGDATSAATSSQASSAAASAISSAATSMAGMGEEKDDTFDDDVANLDDVADFDDMGGDCENQGGLKREDLQKMEADNFLMKLVEAINENCNQEKPNQLFNEIIVYNLLALPEGNLSRLPALVELLNNRGKLMLDTSHTIFLLSLVTANVQELAELNAREGCLPVRNWKYEGVEFLLRLATGDALCWKDFGVSGFLHSDSSFVMAVTEIMGRQEAILKPTSPLNTLCDAMEVESKWIRNLLTIAVSNSVSNINGAMATLSSELTLDGPVCQGFTANLPRNDPLWKYQSLLGPLLVKLDVDPSLGATFVQCMSLAELPFRALAKKVMEAMVGDAGKLSKKWWDAVCVTIATAFRQVQAVRDPAMMDKYTALDKMLKFPAIEHPDPYEPGAVIQVPYSMCVVGMAVHDIETMDKVVGTVRGNTPDNVHLLKNLLHIFNKSPSKTRTAIPEVDEKLHEAFGLPSGALTALFGAATGKPAMMVQGINTACVQVDKYKEKWVHGLTELFLFLHRGEPLRKLLVTEDGTGGNGNNNDDEEDDGPTVSPSDMLDAACTMFRRVFAKAGCVSASPSDPSSTDAAAGSSKGAKEIPKFSLEDLSSAARPEEINPVEIKKREAVVMLALLTGDVELLQELIQASSLATRLGVPETGAKVLGQLFELISQKSPDFDFGELAEVIYESPAFSEKFKQVIDLPAIMRLFSSTITLSTVKEGGVVETIFKKMDVSSTMFLFVRLIGLACLDPDKNKGEIRRGLSALTAALLGEKFEKLDEIHALLGALIVLAEVRQTIGAKDFVLPVEAMEDMSLALDIPPELAQGFIALSAGDVDGMAPMADKVCNYDVDKVRQFLQLLKKVLPMLGQDEGGCGPTLDRMALLPQKEMKDMTYEEMFKMFDKDGSGTMDLSEFQDVLKYYGIVLNHHSAARLFSQVDTDGSGVLNAEEFGQAVQLIEMKSADEVLEKMGLSPAILIGVFVGSITLLVMVFMFIFFGISGFAVGSTFGAVVNSALPASAGAGASSEEKKSEDEEEDAVANNLDGSVEGMEAQE
eukprot:Rmarinus@m.15467